MQRSRSSLLAGAALCATIVAIAVTVSLRGWLGEPAIAARASPHGDAQLEGGDLPAVIRQTAPVARATLPMVSDSMVETLAVSDGPIDEFGAAPGSVVVHTSWRARAAPESDEAGSSPADSEREVDPLLDEPAAGIRLTLTAWGAERHDSREIYLKTDAHGLALISNVPAGAITIEADRGGKASADVASGETTEVALSLTPDLFVQGVVLDAQSRPVSGAGIWVSLGSSGEAAANGRIAKYTDEAGRFQLIGLQAGEFIGTEAPGFAASSLQSLKDNPEHELKLSLKLQAQPSTLTGLVRNASGASVEEARVRFVHAPANAGEVWPELLASTDASGTFLIAGLPAGSGQLHIKAKGSERYERDLVIEAGVPQHLEIALAPAVNLLGVVRAANGAPIEGADVWVQPRSGSTQHEQTDEGGNYAFYDIDGLTLQLSARHEGHGVARVDLKIKPGDQPVQDLTLMPCPGISGRIVHEDGTAAAGYSVQVTARAELSNRSGPEWPLRLEVETDSQGRFSFANCPGPDYELTAYDTEYEDALPGPRMIQPGEGDLVINVPVRPPEPIVPVGPRITVY